ncbi:MAG: PaaX family transcriptional regulator C-terminal domain-containing protein [Bacteroidota bacterium]
MYLKIKRKESVSSILLFIFNVFLVERGITSIPLRKIFKILEPFQKNETAIRMGLSRELQNGLLINGKENGEVHYYLTETALNGFKYWMKTMDYDRAKMQLQLADWNSIWSILALNNRMELERTIYEKISEELRQISYGLLNKNVWISPYLQTKLILELSQKYHIENEVHLFESRLSNLESISSLVSTIWPINKLYEQYQAFLENLTNESKLLNIESRNGGGGLPVLYRLGFEYFEIVQDDPRLPLQLLPSNWPGLQAAKSFNQLRERILPNANNFINNILYMSQ